MNLVRYWRGLQSRSVFGANAALTAATNLVLAMLGMITGVMAARLLGPHGRGELAAIQTYPIMIGQLSMLGTGQAVVYYAASRPERTRQYMACASVISLLAGIPLIVAGYAAMPWVLSAQSSQIVTAARWYLINVPVVAFMSVWFFALRGRSAFVPWNALRTTPTLAWLGVLAGAWYWGISDPRWVAGIYLASLIALLIPIELVVRQSVSGSFVPEAGNFKPMLSYGLPCVASNFPVVLNLRLDQMLMAGLLSPSALGLYVVAVAWSGAVNPLMNAIASVLFPKVAANEMQADRLRSFSRGCRLAALVALITTPILALLTPWGVVILFGSSFRGAIGASLILVPAGGIVALNAVLEDGFRGLGEPAAVLYAELAGLVTTAAGLYLMLRPMGIIGASVASLLGYSTVMAALLLQARLLTGQSAAALLLPTADELGAGIRQLTLLARRMVPAISRV
jgi:O-antigen/teichoic acid export membrane protein